jgi:hypothetical protein
MERGGGRKLDNLRLLLLRLLLMDLEDSRQKCIFFKITISFDINILTHFFFSFDFLSNIQKRCEDA